MTLTAEAAFDSVGAELDACGKGRSVLPARRVALSLGFVDRKDLDPQLLSECVYTDDQGGTVLLSERWHDASEPGQKLPKIHRVRLTLLLAGGGAARRSVAWEK